MSLLIEDQNPVYFEHNTVQKLDSIKAKQIFIGIHKYNPMFQNAVLTQKKSKKQAQVDIETFNQIFQKQGMLRVTFQHQKYHIFLSMVMVDNKLPMAINSQKVLLEVIREANTLISRYLLGSFSNLNVTISKGGLISLQCSLLISKQVIFNYQYFQQFYKSIVKQILQFHTKIFFSIFKISNLLPQYLEQYLEYCIYPHSKQINRQNSIQRYFHKCQILLNIQKKIQKKVQNVKIFESVSDSEEEGSSKVCKQYQSMLGSLNLYANSFGLSLQQKAKMLRQDQVSRFQDLLAQPKPRLYNRMQNRFTFNYIHLLNPQSIQTTSYQLQDYFHYRITKIKFKYAKTSNQQIFLKKGNQISEPELEQTLKQEDNMNECLKKTVFIKEKNRGQDVAKLLHEIQIINKFRLTSSGYLFKYYRSTQTNFPFKERLLIDAYTGITFDNFLIKNELTFSLRMKIMYLTQLAHAFCFLRQNNVAYLSFSKKKIILRLNDKGLLKLVDFSSSYHKGICENYQKFVPDYTIQYVAPQIFMNHVTIYNQKQDVFSLGMLAYQLLNNQILLKYSQQKIIEKYKSLQVIERELICPEKGQYICYRRIYHYLFLLIRKCINSNARLRPSPHWIVIILKQIMSLLVKI